MSVHVESWAWQQKVGSPIRKLILVKLAQNSDDDGWSWWRQRRMAEECEVRRQTITEHINALRGLGILQVIPMPREDGGRGINKYRILGPWVDDPLVRETDRPRPADGQALVRETDKKGTVSREPSGGKTPPSPPGIEPLGRRRFRVASFSTEGKTYTVDLGRRHCTCPAGGACRHLEEASRYEEEATTALRREFRDAIWDVLVDLFGKPTERGEADRGLQVAELAEMLADDTTVSRLPVTWAAEVRARYEALVREWGAGKATLRALVSNWHLAGRLVRPVSNTVGQPTQTYTKPDNV